MFYQIQDKIVIGPHLAKQILNCSRNIVNSYDKDWNSTYSNILLHALVFHEYIKRKNTILPF
jgi:hypothetical protein